MATTKPLEKRPETEVARTEKTRSRMYFRPPVDIVELSDELLVLAEMPGLKSDNIDINFESGVLTIYGRAEDRQAEDTRFSWREYGIGDFYRTFEVSEAIDASRISAEYELGVLTLHLPKVEAAKPRKIQVQAK